MCSYYPKVVTLLEGRKSWVKNVSNSASLIRTLRRLFIIFVFGEGGGEGGGKQYLCGVTMFVYNCNK